jgi:hypothetical protein
MGGDLGELLPQPWGSVGQWLPVGAGGSLLRSTAFFDGAGSAGPLWVLAGYALAGLVLALVGRAAPESPLSREAGGRASDVAAGDAPELRSFA